MYCSVASCVIFSVNEFLQLRISFLDVEIYTVINCENSLHESAEPLIFALIIHNLRWVICTRHAENTVRATKFLHDVNGEQKNVSTQL